MNSSSLLDRLPDLAKSAERCSTEQEFFRDLLQNAANDAVVTGALVWRPAPDGSLEQVAAAGAPPVENDDRTRLLAESLETGERRILLNGTANHPARTLHWPVAGRLIELDFVPGQEHEERQREWLRFLEAAEPHLTKFLTTVDDVAAPVDPPKRTMNPPGVSEQDFLTSIHSSLQLTRLGYTIAHEGRRYVGCDRVGVLIGASDELRVVSISGAERVDDRSVVARSMTALASTVVLTGTPLIYEEGRSYAPQLEELLHDYVDASHVRAAIFEPLVADHDGDSATCGVLVVEWFERMAVDQALDRVQLVAQHSAVAVRNALDYAEVAWARAVLPVAWARAIWRTGRRRWTVSVAVILAFATAVLLLTPANLVVLAHGELQPAERQHVYAAVDGFVEEVLFDDTQSVAKDAPLLRMSNMQLDIDLDKVRSDIDFWEQKLDSIEVLRVRDRDENGRESDPAQRAADEADVRQQLANLRREEQLLEEKVKLLEITSPVPGRVITWNAVEQLDYRRYVNRSDRLLTVANTDGDWILELEIPERDSGHVAEALAEHGAALEVSYILVSHPESTFHAQLTELELGTQWDRHQQASVGASASLVEGRPSIGRAGTTIQARIHCGRRSLGYVWFHDLYEAVWTRLWY